MFWKVEYYRYIVLPNGFSLAVRVFTKVLATPFKYIKSKGYLSTKYVDDSLLLGETFEIFFKNIIATVALLRKLGFTIHPEKLVLVTTQMLKFIEFVTDERKQSYYTHCQKVLSDYEATIRELGKNIGVIVSSFRVVPYS